VVLRGLESVAVGVALCCGWGTVRAARAQMVSVPVLQNAFLNPGVTLGANFASAKQETVYGGAVAWAPARSIVQLSAGLALFNPDTGSSRATWGARAMVPIPKVGTRSIGVAAFAGVGGVSVGGATETWIPVGATVGYRRALGERRAISLYVAPFLNWARLKQDTVSAGTGFFRVSVGLDVVIVPQLGLTVGYEGGGRASTGEPGPAGGLFGVGLSYALRRQ
jgi:hypothetical protein